MMLTDVESKTCTKCKEDKPITEFDKGKAQCKKCRNDYNKAYQRTPKGRAAGRKRYRYPERVARRQRRREDPEWKAKECERQRRRMTDPEEQIKNNARSMLRRYVMEGKIVKEPCVVCGEPDTHGHHEDYSKPLEVVWYCPKHHMEYHRLQREEV